MVRENKSIYLIMPENKNNKKNTHTVVVIFRNGGRRKIIIFGPVIFYDSTHRYREKSTKMLIQRGRGRERERERESSPSFYSIYKDLVQ